MISLDVQIEEMKRELELARRFYARQVAARHISQVDADTHRARLDAALGSLIDLQWRECTSLRSANDKRKLRWPTAWAGLGRISWRQIHDRQAQGRVDYQWLLGNHSETEFVGFCLDCLPPDKRRTIVLRIAVMTMNHQQRRTRKILNGGTDAAVVRREEKIT